MPIDIEGAHKLPQSDSARGDLKDPRVLKFKRYFKAGSLEDLLEKFDTVHEKIDPKYRPVLRPAASLQSEMLGLEESSARFTADEPSGSYGPRGLIRGELFAAGKALFSLAIGTRLAPPEAPENRGTIQVCTITLGPNEDDNASDYVQFIEGHFGVELNAAALRSDRARRIHQDGFSSAPAPTVEEIAVASALLSKNNRTLALAIKSGSGLLVTDLDKHLHPNSRGNSADAQRALREAGIVSVDIVVMCKKTGNPINKIASRSDLEAISKIGLRCSCGRLVADERVEEALTITPLGASMLDKSRWMTVILVHELGRLEIELSSIFVEQQVGGDEIDCIAIINGDVVLFELKDGEFSLGHAYSLNSKVGLIRPDLSAIWTTERVGGDSREHFERRQQVERESYRTRAGREAQASLVYIEGVACLRHGLAELANKLAANDAKNALSDLLPMAGLRPSAALLGWMGSATATPDTESMPEPSASGPAGGRTPDAAPEAP